MLVESQHPYSVWATKSQIMEIYAHYENNKYDDAIIAADRFIQLHPGHTDVAYAYYMNTICYYMQIADVGGDEVDRAGAEHRIVRRFPDSKCPRCQAEARPHPPIIWPARKWKSADIT